MDDLGRRPRRRRWLIAALAALFVAGFVTSRSVCLSAWVRYGLDVRQCPDGEIRQTAHVSAALRRGQAGSVTVGATAHYTSGASDFEQTAPVGRVEASLALVDAAGKATPLDPAKEWRDAGDALRADITLPKVPDGEYKLRATVETPLGKSTVDAPLSLLAPARVHVLTDRPLYEPGNTVRFRAVVLRARDLAPLDGRPGRWTVTQPDGEVVLEERAPAGDWGVVAGNLPLDEGAPTGWWSVQWTSGDATAKADFRVEPFTLPRFRVEATPSKPFYRAGDRPVVKGSVVYSSGAPVANAVVVLRWSASGDWPPPTDWMDGALPTSAKSDAAGRFTLDLPAIPNDLRGRATLSAHLSAVDPAGDRVASATSLLLSEDAIQVSAVTELRDGLVAGFNNRMYLRATTADGTVLPGAELLVRRAWDPSDKGTTASTDEDGVASLQIDPGPAVNVIVPPQPVRPPKPTPAVQRMGARDLLGADLDLADQRALDGWLRPLEPCARWVAYGSEAATVGVQSDASGAVRFAIAEATPLSRCVADVARTMRLPPGRARVFALTFQFAGGNLPSVEVLLDSVPENSGDLHATLSQAALDARPCLPRDAEGSLPAQMIWRLKANSRDVGIDWVRGAGSSLPANAVTCMQSRLSRITLSEPAENDMMGTAGVTISPAPTHATARPQPTVMQGYEFVVAARKDGRELGSTKLRLRPGTVPPVRLRATPVLASAGGKVDVEILRGPGFSGELPKELFLSHPTREALKGKVDEKRVAHFELPADAEGWFEASFSGARALVYVRPRSELQVALTPDQARYAPGQIAKLALHTTAGGKGTRAAVGLVGVDESLSQLAALPGPDELSSVRSKVETTSPAFDALDGQALAMGRIRGTNAAAATILRVGAVPQAAELDATASTQAQESFDAIAELTDSFYTVLSELHAQSREWERTAPEGEQVKPALMAKLWQQALDACEKRGAKVTDAYGRRLRLSRLPSDLLAQTDPRMVVVTGTRLPEDVEDWPAWVAKERP